MKCLPPPAPAPHARLPLWQVAVVLMVLLLLPVRLLVGQAQAQTTPAARPLRRGLMVTPLSHTLRLPPGARTSVQFQVTNFAAAPRPLEVRVVDVNQDEFGSPRVVSPGNAERSCAAWVRLREGRYTLGAGKTQVVRAEVAVPPRRAGSFHAGITVAVPATTAPPGSSAANITAQVLLGLHIIVAGTERPAAALEAAEMVPAGQVIRSTSPLEAEHLRDRWALVPRVRNSGNTFLRLRGDVIITTLRGTLVGRYELSPGPGEGRLILPGAAVRFPILINDLLREPSYLARLTLTYAGQKGYSVPLTLVPRTEGDPARAAIVPGAVERTGLRALVEPSLLVAPLPGGGVRAERMTVSNLESFAVVVQVAVTALRLDADGTPLEMRDVPAPGWVSVAPAAFRLGPRQSRAVALRVAPVAGSTDSVALVTCTLTGIDAGSNSTGTGLSPPNNFAPTGTFPVGVLPVAARLRTLVVWRDAARPSTPALKLQQAALTPTAQGPLLSLLLQGDPMLPAAFSSSAIELLPSEPQDGQPRGPVARVADSSPVLLLPGGMRRLDFPLPHGLEAGNYDAWLHLVPARGSRPGDPRPPTVRLEFRLLLTAPQK